MLLEYLPGTRLLLIFAINDLNSNQHSTLPDPTPLNIQKKCQSI